MGRQQQLFMKDAALGGWERCKHDGPLGGLLYQTNSSEAGLGSWFRHGKGGVARHTYALGLGEQINHHGDP